MTFDHRPFHTDDAPQICGFVQSAEELFFFIPEAGFPLSTRALIVQAGNAILPTVVLKQGRVAGYIDFLDITEKRFCTIGRLVVDPGLRRQGTARYLMQTMIDVLVAQHHVKFVRAACFSHNTPAYRLLHDIGFRPDNMKPRTTTDGQAALMVNMIFSCRRPGA